MEINTCDYKNNEGKMLAEQKVSFLKNKHVQDTFKRYLLREGYLQNRWSDAKIHFTLIEIQENLFLL